MNNPEIFTKAELYKEPKEYVEWLCSGPVWGGQPELKALSIHFQTEFAVLDIVYEEVLVFGLDHGYKQRVYVLYDGTHYNLVVSDDSKTFDPADDKAYQGCLNLAKECRDAGESIYQHLD